MSSQETFYNDGGMSILRYQRLFCRKLEAHMWGKDSPGTHGHSSSLVGQRYQRADSGLHLMISVIVQPVWHHVIVLFWQQFYCLDYRKYVAQFVQVRARCHSTGQQRLSFSSIKLAQSGVYSMLNEEQWPGKLCLMLTTACQL